MDVFFYNNFRKLHVPWAVFILPTTCLLAELLERGCPQPAVDVGHTSCAQALFPQGILGSWNHIKESTTLAMNNPKVNKTSLYPPLAFRSQVTSRTQRRTL